LNLYASFQAITPSESTVDFVALPLSQSRPDFLGKASDGAPVFLLQDSSSASYAPAIELKYVSVQFHNKCRVTTNGVTVEDQFAVISCDASVPELHEVFIRCLAAAVEQLPPVANTSDLQRCVQSLLNLFRSLGHPSNREVTGLWAELFVIAKSKNVQQLLRAWHSNQFERFDFSSPTVCLEVKAAINEQRQHEFSLEQLKSPISGAGYVASILMQPLSGGLGIVDLANEIELSITGEPQLRQKLWANIFATLGVDFSERLDRRFDLTYSERSLAVYSMSDIPAPHEPSDARISAVRFRVDLSTVVSSLKTNARRALDELFH
jgi:Putative  PD-(D/E)XK family member, (DUF4420)